MKVRTARHLGNAEVRIVAVPEGVVPPKRRRAAIAGFTGAVGQVCELVSRRGRLLLAGAGDGSPAAMEGAGRLAAARLGEARRVAVDARGLSGEAASALVAGVRLRAWRDDRWRTKDLPGGPPERLRVVLDDAAGWPAAQAGVEGALLARALVSEPANTLTPEAFTERLKRLRRAGVKVEVLRGEALRAAGLQALCAVGGASVNRPALLVLRWPGRGAPVAFVGKGITFDTGGVCVKPAHGMWEMRADMAAAAACAGAMLALARRGSPAAAVAVLPLAENAIGAASYRPGDVLEIAGRSVEVVDTDAEGRLVLADALAYAVRRFEPRAVLSLATLTGSIIVALGHERAGLFGDATLGAHIAAAEAAVAEPVWPMPIGDAHRRDLDSAIADLRHCVPGSGQPDACHAAAFLREFVGEVPWAHLDIAGVESRAEADDWWAKGATGFGARLLDRLVAMHFEAA